MKQFLFSFLRKRTANRTPGVPYRYHFIHIPKNGGRSVRAALQSRGDVSLGEPLHSRYVDVVGDIGQQLRYFCVVRNPWSRTASRYIFSRQTARSWAPDDPRKIYIESASFEDYVRQQRIFEIPEHPGKPWMGPMNSWFNQLDWISDENQVVRADCLRLECLQQDLRTYFGEPAKIHRENRARQSYDFKKMYTDQLMEIVAETFRRDIEYFGFTFDGPATRGFVGAHPSHDAP